MRTMLLVAALASLAFSGCVTDSTEGYTAMEAAKTLQVQASDWAEDAVFLSVIGLESPTGIPAEDGLNPFFLQPDTTPGDGTLPVWLGTFYSPAKEELAMLRVDSNGTSQLMTMGKGMFGGISSEDVEAASESHDLWAIDSPAAIAAVRASDATVDAAFAANGTAQVYYLLNMLQEASWHVGGQVGAVNFRADVDVATGEVTDLELSDEPFPFLMGPLPTPDGPLPPPISQGGHTQASADPLNFAGMPPCSSPTHECVEIPFNATRAVTIDATLSWGNQANDYDFYVLDAAGTVVLTGASEPGVLGPEHHTAELEAGDFVIQVVPWSVVNDDWTFVATFS